MDEKSVSISVYIENKTKKTRRNPCVHIGFCTVTFCYMLTSYALEDVVTSVLYQSAMVPP